MDLTTIILLFVGLGVGGGVGFFIKKGKIEEFQAKLKAKNEKIKQEAEAKAKEALFEAKNNALKIQEDAKRDEQIKRLEFNKIEQRLLAKEQNLDKKVEESDKNKEDLEKKVEQVRHLKEETKKLYDEQNIKLQDIAALSKEEARELLLKKVEEESKAEIVETIKRAEEDVKKEADGRAKFLIADAIAKYAADTT
ncbi:DUF3552 domain-containing protein, partial [Patescibacteria group bacterium]|nr:DUF3552 domain-containing protein [Patescibacteria group bacterium]